VPGPQALQVQLVELAEQTQILRGLRQRLPVAHALCRKKYLGYSSVPSLIPELANHRTYPLTV